MPSARSAARGCPPKQNGNIQRAARTDSIFPWGDTWDGSLVVWDLSEKDQDAPVGSKPGGMSWIGAYDLIGNVHEYVHDWYSETYYATLADGAINPQGPESGTEHGGRGSAYYQEDPSVFHAAYRARLDDNHAPIRLDGFRCALSYEP